MKIHELTPAEGSTKQSKRIGRGPASRHGKTSTKGHKGQKARAGSGKGPSFEGGQTPLQRRLPKRGFKNMPFKKAYAIMNLSELSKLGIDIITPEILIEKRIVKDLKDGLKILGIGEVSKPMTVKAHAFSASALSKIQASGGKAEVI
jgi:large subunit ribosomal protein L15